MRTAWNPLAQLARDSNPHAGKGFSAQVTDCDVWLGILSVYEATLVARVGRGVRAICRRQSWIVPRSCSLKCRLGALTSRWRTCLPRYESVICVDRCSTIDFATPSRSSRLNEQSQLSWPYVAARFQHDVLFRVVIILHRDAGRDDSLDGAFMDGNSSADFKRHV